MIILLIADEHAIFYVDDIEKRSEKKLNTTNVTQRKKKENATVNNQLYRILRKYDSYNIFRKMAKYSSNFALILFLMYWRNGHERRHFFPFYSFFGCSTLDLFL